MGRIKTDLVKRATKQIVKTYPEELSEDFAKNKEVVKRRATVQSPKLANVIAGYVTRVVKQAKDGKEKKVIAPEDISKFY